MRIKKRERNPEVRWKSVFQVVKRSHIPWLWVALAFGVNLIQNELLIRIPTSTASLLGGSLEASALRDTIFYYVSYAVVLTVWNLLFAQASCLAVKRARDNLWGKMLRVHMSFYDGNDPAELMSAVTSDISYGIDQTTYLMIYLIPELYYVYRATRTIGNYHWLLVVGIVAFVPIKYIYSVIVGKIFYKAEAGIYEEIGGLTGYLAERVRNLPLIKTFTNEKRERENGRRTVDKLVRANMKEVKVGAASSAMIQIIDFIQQFLLIVLGVVLLQQKKITMTQWVAFFLFSQELINTMSHVVNEWLAIKMVKAALCRAAKIYDAPEEDLEAPGDEPIPETGRDVVFDSVTFSYGDKQALKDVSFKVPEGQTVAIVGLCGSGKTTSLNLLERFYRPDGGQITLGGVDIGRMPLDAYRRCFSYVQQRPEIFSGTVREALTYGVGREVTDEELMEAARVTGIADYIEKQPQGLDTQIAPSGGSLSGGQVQRLVLAREFLRGADVLLLDEPTSALDAQTARGVQDAVLTTFSGKTIIMVTHDLNLTRSVDKIVVLEDGELVGQGTYDSLMAACPLFGEMVAAQAREKEAEA